LQFKSRSIKALRAKRNIGDMPAKPVAERPHF